LKKKNPKTSDPFQRLERLMAQLRAPGGCPWDRKQTHKSLKPYLIEEAHEALEAIDQGNMPALREELGDVLLQVVFHAQIAHEKGHFGFRDVANTLSDKLERRHPHVFGTEGKSTIDQVNARWEQIKKKEKPDRKSPLEGLPQSLPALHRAQRMHEKLAKGHPQESPKVLNKILESRWKNFQTSLKNGSKKEIERTAGNFLLAFTALAQAKSLHAEMALRAASSNLERANQGTTHHASPPQNRKR
jgi:tetrapyrrole methylase family protein/MazG family protein